MQDFGKIIRDLGARGESAYGNVNGENVIDIPAQACKGRAGVHGKTFSGYFNMETGEMRFDCAEELPFYLQIDLSKVPALAYQPGASKGIASIEAATAAAERAEERMAAERPEKRAMTTHKLEIIKHIDCIMQEEDELSYDREDMAMRAYRMVIKNAISNVDDASKLKIMDICGKTSWCDIDLSQHLCGRVPLATLRMIVEEFM